MKNERIHLRVTPEEKELLQKKADELGMTISQYVRFCCLVNTPKITHKRV